jgi:hypothetical protein
MVFNPWAKTFPLLVAAGRCCSLLSAPAASARLRLAPVASRPRWETGGIGKLTVSSSAVRRLVLARGLR